MFYLFLFHKPSTGNTSYFGLSCFLFVFYFMNRVLSVALIESKTLSLYLLLFPPIRFNGQDPLIAMKKKH